MSYGVDYSYTSVKKSIEFNKELIDEGKVSILEADVLDLPFEDNMFNVAFAFETVYFWPDIIDAFIEVRRVLRPKGKFLISLVCNDNDFKMELEDPKMEGFNAYNADELQNLLETAGFKKIISYIKKHEDTQKIIRTYENNIITDKSIEDNFKNEGYSREESENNRWLCIIAEK